MPEAPVADGPAEHDHVVGIYGDAEQLISAVVDLVAPGLHAGEGAVVVANALHREGVTAGLQVRGIDVAAAQADARLLLVDASELLDAFRDEDGLDIDRFHTEAAALLDRASDDGRRDVRIFGEMVTLLWNEGDVTGALALEDLWEDLLRRRPATLLCGYPADAFAHDRSTDAFRAVCDRHTEVVTTASVPSGDERARTRTVALLEHERIVDRNRRSDLEAQQRALEDALNHLRRATARRDELLAVVVHDIRSPASMVTNALRLILEEGPELGWEDTRMMLETAHEAAERISRLSRDLLTSSELDAGSFTYDLRPLDLVRVVTDAVQEFRAATGRVVELSAELDLPPVLADEVRQRQVLGNLLGNAHKFSPADRPIQVDVTGTGGRLEVRVRDAGPGIGAADQERLFEPFTRLDTASGVEGSGLGLHSAKLLTEGQGGAIWVESEPGAGSVFAYTVLTLPGHEARRH